MMQNIQQTEQTQNSIGNVSTETKPIEEKRPSASSRLEKWFLSHFYGTEQFYASYKEPIEVWIKERMRLFDALPENVFTTGAKSELREVIKHHVGRIAGLSIWWNAVAHFYFNLFLTNIFQYLYSGIAATAFFSATPPKGHILWWFWPYLIFVYSLVLYISFLKNRFLNSATARIRITTAILVDLMFMLFYSIITYRIIHQFKHRPLPYFWDVTLVGTRTGIYIALLDIIGSLGFIFSAYCFVRWRNSKYPDSVIIDDLLVLIASFEFNSANWNNLTQKRDTVSSLEEVAICYERYLPARLACRNSVIKAWQRQMFLGVSSAIRDSMRWILMPKADSRQCLVQRLKEFLLHTVIGDWDALEQTRLEDLPVPASRVNRAIATARTLVMIVIVPLGVYSFHLIQPKEHLPALVVAAAIEWPVISLLAALDPDIKSKIEAFRSAIQIIPGSSDKK